MLEYLFSASFKDGSTYSQNAEDISNIEPSKSCFYDVLQLEKDNKNPVLIFCISDGEKTYLVDLRDGRFDINGASFYLHDVEESLNNMRLVYFRRHWHTLSFGGEQKEHFIAYILGWQANGANGENIQKTITIT